MRFGDSFVKQTNKLVVLIFYNIIIYVFLSIRCDKHSEIIFFRILLCGFHAIVKAIRAAQNVTGNAVALDYKMLARLFGFELPELKASGNWVHSRQLLGC